MLAYRFSSRVRTLTSHASSRPSYDVIVIGGGHAGSEAAAAAARMGARVGLVTSNESTIGTMSCNPSIGGLGKGHLVREIDAMDGIMAKAADLSAMQWRLLAQSRGRAVQAPRVQCDRTKYKLAVQSLLLGEEARSMYKYPIDVIEATVKDFVLKESSSGFECDGVVLSDGEQIMSGAVVLTTGTFMNGVMHVGKNKAFGGRLGESSTSRSESLSSTLQHKLKLTLARLKTGTPPRIDSNSVNVERLEEQQSDFQNYEPISLLHASREEQFRQRLWDEQQSVYKTYTNPTTHEIVRECLASGFGAELDRNVGPRYCPSIELKISRFSHVNEHVVWLEFEKNAKSRSETPQGGVPTPAVVYPQGLSCAIPEEYQERMIKSITGLENAKIVQYGYAVEYDHVCPTQIKPTLELKVVDSLFMAGQINGTTGYEEAAAQGLMAGLNAGLKASSKAMGGKSSSSFTLARDESYLGVLVDDLSLLGASEPYRMLTCRSEHRLRCRCDNADSRLMAKGLELGCISNERRLSYENRREMISQIKTILESVRMKPIVWNEKYGSKIMTTTRTNVGPSSAMYVLEKCNVALTDLIATVPELYNAFESHGLLASKTEGARRDMIWTPNFGIRADIISAVEAELKYNAYIEKSDVVLARFEQRGGESVRIPDDFDFNQVPGLSYEAREKLAMKRPATIKEARDISGVPKDSQIILGAYLRKQYQERKQHKGSEKAKVADDSATESASESEKNMYI